MFFRHLKNVLSRQDSSKTKLRCLEDVLHRLGIKSTEMMQKSSRKWRTYFEEHLEK